MTELHPAQQVIGVSLNLVLINDLELATILDMCGERIRAVSNQYEAARLRKQGNKAADLARKGIPGIVTFGFAPTPRLKAIVQAYHRQIQDRNMQRDTEIKASEQDAARIIANYEIHRKGVKKAWKEVEAMVVDVRPDGTPFAVSVNASPETLARINH